MASANATRGELTIAMEGADYVLRPSYEAQVAIETQTGKSIQQLAIAAGDGSLSIAHAAIVVAECCKAQGKALVAAGDEAGRPMTGFRAEVVAPLLVDEGMLKVAVRLELLLFLANTGGYSAQGERKAPASKTATPADA